MSVYVNRTLNMKSIQYVGLDMDHTLVRYHSEPFEHLAYKNILKRLVSDLDYPKSILNLQFDYKRAIRGLIIDKQGGNLLKVSCFGAIRVSYHGSRLLDFKTQRYLFKNKYIDLRDPQFDPVDTTFSISFATLFAQLVDLKDGTEAHNLPEYSQIADDITETLDKIHNDGTLKSIVTANISNYIVKDERIVEGLERYIQHGKKFFIITNSDFNYTKTLLDYAIDPFLKSHSSWMDLFEYVIVSSQKPRFFYDNSQFLKIDPKTGLMSNISGSLQPGIYQSGCAPFFTSNLKLNPSEILYIGDHIYADVLRLKKDCAWRTGLIVEEIEDEVNMNRAASDIYKEISALMDKKFYMELELDDMISYQIENRYLDYSNDVYSNIDKYIGDIKNIGQEVSGLTQKRQEFFNPYWGEVMRAGTEESYFAYQVERFACVYMSKLYDFLSKSPRFYFRSFQRQLPHDE